MAAVAELFGWVFSLFDYLDDLRNLINEFIGLGMVDAADLWIHIDSTKYGCRHQFNYFIVCRFTRVC